MNKAALQRLLREPLLHFIAIGGLLFLFYATLNEADKTDKQNIIVIDPQRITQIKSGFNSIWKRQPTESELDQLIENDIREEVYYRDALMLGLDKNDVIVKKRLRQKLEFLSETGIYLLAPSEDELKDFYIENIQRYQRDPRLAFEQIYLGETPTEKTINQSLNSVHNTPSIDPFDLGVRSQLPAQLRLSRAAEIDNIFGPGFFKQLAAFAPGVWNGPVISGYGVHLVRTLDGEPALTPPLQEIRESVLNDLQASKAEQAREQDYMRRRSGFVIEIHRDNTL